MKLLIGRYPKGDNERKVNIRIDNYDLWDLGHTLALIVHPALVKFRENLLSTPMTDPSDGLETSIGNEPDFSEERWAYIIDEMIFAFDALAKDDWEDQYFDYIDVDLTGNLIDQLGKAKIDREGLIKHNARIDNGLRLFGKYFRGLWY